MWLGEPHAVTSPAKSADANNGERLDVKMRNALWPRAVFYRATGYNHTAHTEPNVSSNAEFEFLFFSPPSPTPPPLPIRSSIVVKSIIAPHTRIHYKKKNTLENGAVILGLKHALALNNKRKKKNGTRIVLLNVIFEFLPVWIFESTILSLRFSIFIERNAVFFFYLTRLTVPWFRDGTNFRFLPRCWRVL